MAVPQKYKLQYQSKFCEYCCISKLILYTIYGALCHFKGFIFGYNALQILLLLLFPDKVRVFKNVMLTALETSQNVFYL